MSPLSAQPDRPHPPDSARNQRVTAFPPATKVGGRSYRNSETIMATHPCFQGYVFANHERGGSPSMRSVKIGIRPVNPGHPYLIVTEICKLHQDRENHA